MIYEYYGTFKIDWKKFYGTIHSEYGFEQNWLEFKRYTRSGVILDADTKTDRKTNTKIMHILYKEEERPLIHYLWPDIIEQPYVGKLPEFFNSRVYRHNEPWDID